MMRLIILTLLLLLSLSAHLFSDTKRAYEYNEKGVSELEAGRSRIAIQYFIKSLSEAPHNSSIRSNLSKAYYMNGRELLKRGENFNAIDQLKKSLRYDPNNAYAHVDLGRSYYKMNNMNSALFYLKKANRFETHIDGVEELISKIEREMRSERGLNKIESSHFIIMSSPKLRSNNLSNIRVSCEQAYNKIGAFFNYFQQQKTIVVVYPVETYRELESKGLTWAHASFDGKIKIPLTGGLYSKRYIDKIIYHEFTHALIREMIGATCPLWLNEGLASYVEDFIEPKRRDFFKPFIVKGNITPFSKLPTAYTQIKTARQANKHYREFYFVADFLVKKLGNSGTQNLLKGLGAGHSFSYLIKKLLRIDMIEFSRQWERHIERTLGF